MDEQRQLKEALSALFLLAEASKRRLTKAQVEEACQEIGLDERQTEMVCAYLEMNHVTIEGFAAKEEDRALFREADDTPEKKKAGAGSAHFDMYLKELESLARYEEHEEEALLKAMRAGDGAARERLIEGNLFRVVQVSREYEGRGVPTADLVQEGNIALLQALDTCSTGANISLYLLTEIENAMIRAIQEQTGADDVSQCLAADANALLKATETLARELGREASAGELAAHLHMSRQRVETLVRMSLDAMNLDLTE